MEKLASLFKVFDVAFLAPGFIILLVLWRVEKLSGMGLSNLSSLGEGIAIIGTMVAGAYLIGLVCHSIQRVGYKLWGRSAKRWVIHRLWSPDQPPVNGNDDESSNQGSWFRCLSTAHRFELAQYFWYMRAVCWNVSVAIIIGNLIVYTYAEGTIPFYIMSLASVVFLLFTGIEFDVSTRSALEAPLGGLGKRAIEEPSN